VAWVVALNFLIGSLTWVAVDLTGNWNYKRTSWVLLGCFAVQIFLRRPSELGGFQKLAVFEPHRRRRFCLCQLLAVFAKVESRAKATCFVLWMGTRGQLSGRHELITRDYRRSVATSHARHLKAPRGCFFDYDSLR